MKPEYQHDPGQNNGQSQYPQAAPNGPQPQAVQPQAQPSAPQYDVRSEPQATQTPQPVAYDTQGRPLYAAPPERQVVYVTRPLDPVKTEVPADIQQKHEESCRRYPQLNLSEGEYIITDLKRHPIGLAQIWVIAGALILAFIGLGAAFLSNQGDSGGLNLSQYSGSIVAIMGLFFILILAGAFIATYVYNSNRFFLTNESVIQEIQLGVFSRHEQTVSLGNIEDASYMQNGILQSMFNYGLIRLSTEGDETTYRFNYASDPKRNIAILNNAVESFKNGRPVE